MTSEALKVVWRDKNEAGLELCTGERLVAFREVKFSQSGRRQTKWTAQWVDLRNMSQTNTTSARSVEALAEKLGKEKWARSTSVRN